MCPMPSEAKHICRPNDTRRIWILGPVCFWSAKILLCGAFSSAITWSVHKKFRGWGLRQPWIVRPQTFHSCRLDRDLNLLRILFIYLSIVVFRCSVIAVISGLRTRSRRQRWKTNTQIELLKSIFSFGFDRAPRGVYSKWFVRVRASTATLPIYELWAGDEGWTTPGGVTAVGQNEETTPFASPERIQRILLGAVYFSSLSVPWPKWIIPVWIVDSNKERIQIQRRIELAAVQQFTDGEIHVFPQQVTLWSHFSIGKYTPIALCCGVRWGGVGCIYTFFFRFFFRFLA